VTVAELARKVRLVELRARRASSGVIVGRMAQRVQGSRIEVSRKCANTVPGRRMWRAHRLETSLQARAGGGRIHQALCRRARDQNRDAVWWECVAIETAFQACSATKSALAQRALRSVGVRRGGA